MEEDSEFTNVHLKNAMLKNICLKPSKVRQMKIVTQQILKAGQPMTVPVTMSNLDQKVIVSSFSELEPAREITVILNMPIQMLLIRITQLVKHSNQTILEMADGTLSLDLMCLAGLDLLSLKITCLN